MEVMDRGMLILSSVFWCDDGWMCIGVFCGFGWVVV